jgi:hypothetical protein
MQRTGPSRAHVADRLKADREARLRVMVTPAHAAESHGLNRPVSVFDSAVRFAPQQREVVRGQRARTGPLSGLRRVSRDWWLIQ